MGRHEVSKRVVNPELLGTSVSGRFLRGRAGLPDTVPVAGKRVDALPFRHGKSARPTRTPVATPHRARRRVPQRLHPVCRRKQCRKLAFI